VKLIIEWLKKIIEQSYENRWGRNFDFTSRKYSCVARQRRPTTRDGFSSNSDGLTVQEFKPRSKRRKKFSRGQFCQQILTVGQLTPNSPPRSTHAPDPRAWLGSRFWVSRERRRDRLTRLYDMARLVPKK
jgi:hypothetical protein